MTDRFFQNIGETHYTETLPNGLTIHVLPQPGFMRSFAMFATNYGGAMRRFELAGRSSTPPRASRISSNTRCSICRTGRTR
jgi:hypothetical protein